MIQSQFKSDIKIMIDSFPVSEKRISSLEYFFGREDQEVLREAATNAAKNGEKFPTNAVFGEIVRTVRRNLPRQVELIECDFCGGAGHVSAQKWTTGEWFSFACQCRASTKYPKLPPWTKKKREEYHIENTYNQIPLNLEKYKKGLNYIKKHCSFFPENVGEQVDRMIRQAEKVPF